MLLNVFCIVMIRNVGLLLSALGLAITRMFIVLFDVFDTVMIRYVVSVIGWALV